MEFVTESNGLTISTDLSELDIDPVYYTLEEFAEDFSFDLVDLDGSIIDDDAEDEEEVEDVVGIMNEDDSDTRNTVDADNTKNFVTVY